MKTSAVQKLYWDPEEEDQGRPLGLIPDEVIMVLKKINQHLDEDLKTLDLKLLNREDSEWTIKS